jgi:hypothetical protein
MRRGETRRRPLKIGDRVKVVGSRSESARGHIIDEGRLPGTWSVMFGGIGDFRIDHAFDASALVALPRLPKPPLYGPLPARGRTVR